MTRSRNHPSESRERCAPKPLDQAALEELALAYVARFATSAGRLAAYCRRKLRERGHFGADDGAAPPDVTALVARFVAKGFVDDVGFARAKADALLRRANQIQVEHGSLYMMRSSCSRVKAVGSSSSSLYCAPLAYSAVTSK